MISFRRAMVLSVMWSTSVAAVEWTKLSSSSDAPSPRARHTMVVLADGSAVMFGGFDYWNYLNDIYSLTVTGTIARWVQLSSVPRMMHVFMEVHVLEGGVGGLGWCRQSFSGR